MAKGYVYAARVPGEKHVKIGKTNKAPEVRRGQLNNTSVLADFEFEFVLAVRKPHDVEKIAHAMLADCRIRKNREFFLCSKRKARSAIKKAAIESGRWKWIPNSVRKVMNIVHCLFLVLLGTFLVVVILFVVDTIFFQKYFHPAVPIEGGAVLSSMLRFAADVLV